MAAADVGDARAALQLRLDAVERRDPGADQVAEVARAKEALGAVEQDRILVAPVEPAAGAEGLRDARLGLHRRGDHLERAGEKGRARLVGERRRLLGRQRVAPARPAS